MSMNKYMHPRNIYKEPPNFRQLALDYPEFRKHIIQDVTGKVSVDFKNVEALRALTCTLLKKDFNLDIELPLNKMIPTIPLRLNYILWIEDLLSISSTSKEPVKGIDIGTGASCVYPLMAAAKNKWSMIAFEIDHKSIQHASKNIEKNQLGHLINLIEINDDKLLEEMNNLVGDYDFCMCNPPFFSSTLELHPFFKTRTQNRPHPRNAFCASVNEVVSKGGEVEYISKIMSYSKVLGKKIKIYSTMIGLKSNLPPLKKLLRELNVISFKQTEFCQGHTTRWGLAWTFYDIDLQTIPNLILEAKKLHSTKPLIYNVPQEEMEDVNEFNQKILKILNELQFDITPLNKLGKHSIDYTIVAYTNTWSHQRRKRREMARKNNKESNNEIHETCESLAAIDFDCGVHKKRLHEDDDNIDDGYYGGKKIKSLPDEDVGSKAYLKCKIVVTNDNNLSTVELYFIDGIAGKDGVHQILQYLKNNLK